tara:strand:- start:1831 stop:2469 length:639 start_codon:yes stop_codon:yes gene_type:complete
MLLTAVGPLTFLGGVLFLTILVAYCVITFYMARKAVASGEDPGIEIEEHDPLSLGRSLAYIVLGIGGLVLGAHLIIAGGVGIAEFYHVPQEWIGLTLLAFGTSLPEIGAAIAAALRRHGEVAIGNVLGSNVFNILGAGGIISLFGPIEIAPTFTQYDHWVMAFAALLIGGFILTRARLGRLMGVLMLLIYAAYIYGLIHGVNLLGLFQSAPA